MIEDFFKGYRDATKCTTDRERRSLLASPSGDDHEWYCEGVTAFNANSQPPEPTEFYYETFPWGATKDVPEPVARASRLRLRELAFESVYISDFGHVSLAAFRSGNPVLVPAERAVSDLPALLDALVSYWEGDSNFALSFDGVAYRGSRLRLKTGEWITLKRRGRH